MDAETSPTSRVVAAVPAQGATWAEIRAKTGLGSAAVDSGVRGAIRARLLALRNGRYFPTHIPPKPLPSDVAIDAEPLRAWRPSRKRLQELERAAQRKREREALHDYWAGLVKRWVAGEVITGEDMRRARKWWARMGRPEL